MILQDYEAEQILRSRTSKLIGGYVTEHLFYKRFLENSGFRWTKDWWGSIERNDSRRLHFFVVKDQLNEADTLFIRRITEAGYDWGQIWNSNGEWVIQADGLIRTIDQYVLDHGLVRINNNRTSHNNSNDPQLDACIEYYRREGMLQHIAQSILLEDAFLNQYFITINFDFIYITVLDRPAVLEIKFKNEFTKNDSRRIRRLVFGMDQVPYDQYFQKLIEAGIYVYNVVLYNDLKNERNKDTTDIFNYLNKKPDAERLWKYKMLPRTMAGYVVHHTDAAHTDFFGNNGRNHYCIPLNEYTPLPDTVGNHNYWGVCPICGGGIEIHEERGREIKKCANYINHPRE